MDTRDILLLAYDAFEGEVRGKTNLQKKLYFLSIMLGIDLGYGPHYYGPFSSDIASTNTSFKVLGYLAESVASGGSYGSEGFEIARHDFRLTNDGRAAVEVKKKRFSELWAKVKTAADTLNAAGVPQLYGTVDRCEGLLPSRSESRAGEDDRPCPHGPTVWLVCYRVRYRASGWLLAAPRAGRRRDGRRMRPGPFLITIDTRGVSLGAMREVGIGSDEL